MAVPLGPFYRHSAEFTPRHALSGVSCSDSDPGQSGGVGCSVTSEIGEIGSVSRGGVCCSVLSRSAFDAVAAG